MARKPASDPDDGTAPPVRRAPFSDNPTVGTRGLRTQQRILDAALEVFGEHGYERSTLDKIGQVAGCSRVSIYQYFAGKDDVFRHLAGQVARQMRASAEALVPLTPDAEGWEALRAWVLRYADIHQRYEPVFRAFGAAAASDEALAGGSVRAGEVNAATFRSKVESTLPPRLLDPVVALLLSSTNRTLDMTAILRAVLPDVYTIDRIADATTDVLHRSLFGARPGVNARPSPAGRTPVLPLGEGLRAEFDRAAQLEEESAQPGRRALASLLEVGQEVIVRRGFQGTRVDDLVAAAGVSHGAFYRYFENRDDLLRIVAVRSLAALSTALADSPPAGDRAALRRWLRRYNDVNVANGAMVRVWVETADDPFRGDRAGVFDWGRRQMARLLRNRPHGDADAEGAVLLAVVESFGSFASATPELDAAVHVVEQGFLTG